MSIAPLLGAGLAIPLHVFAALFALCVGGVQLVLPRGTAIHRTVGYGWVAAMLVVALSTFLIHQIDQWRGFSLIHLLSILVLFTVPRAIHAARRGELRGHRMSMIGLFIGGLVIAGTLTLAPDRRMFEVFFGG